MALKELGEPRDASLQFLMLQRRGLTNGGAPQVDGELFGEPGG